MEERERSSPDMPDDIVMDILSRLPVNSLLQFKCVSKQWWSLTTDSQFIRSHLTRSLVSSTHYRILLPTSPLLSVNYDASSSIPDTPIQLDCPLANSCSLIKILGSCNGLVCLLVDSVDMVICNPSTRSFKALPPPLEFPNSSHGSDCAYGFGCDLTHRDFKLVRISRFGRDSIHSKFVVFGLGNASWRNVDFIQTFDFVDEVGTFLNGAIHWLARHSVAPHEAVIVSFSVSKEVFMEISLPPNRRNLPYYNLGVLDGCLYVLCDNACFTRVDVWLMKDYGVRTSWIKLFTIPRDMGIEYISYLVPLCFLKEGEVLLEIDLKEFVVYDIKMQRFWNPMICADQNCFGGAVVYVESLVSPSSF